MDMENIVSKLDTRNIEMLKAVARLAETLRQHMNRVSQAMIDFTNRWAEYIKRAARRKEHYLRRMEYLKRKKKRRRKKPTHGRKRRGRGIL